MISTIKKFSLVVIIAFLGIAMAKAQTQNPKIIALLNKASWCSVCRTNGPRVEKDLMPMLMQDKNVQVIMNDLSDKKTISKSLPMIKKAGIASFAKENTGSGMLYFIDANSKKLITSISIDESNEDIMMAYKKSLSKTAMSKHGEKGHVCDENCKTKM